jgi:hypothetical protein
MARFDFKFDYQAGSGYTGKIHADVYPQGSVPSISMSWAAFKITAPDGTVFKDADVAFGVGTPTSTPTIFDVSNFYVGAQFWGGVNFPTDSTGAYQKGVYTIVAYVKRQATAGGAISMTNETITYSFCPVTNALSPYVAKLVRTLNCAGGKLKLDDLTNYTGWTVSSHLLTITPPVITGVAPTTTSLNSLQISLTYTNVSYAYSMSANGVKEINVTPTNFYDSLFRVAELVTWSTATSVFVACANLCSVASCAKTALMEMEAKRAATGKQSEADSATTNKILARLALIQTDMICGGLNIDQYISELQTIIKGVCNCGATSTTPTPFINSMTV